MSASTLTTIRVGGELGRKYGREFKLNVSSPREAAIALCNVIPGFRQDFIGKDGKAAYSIHVGKQRVSDTEVDHPVGRKSIRITPIVAGAKRGGIGQIIVGAVLIVASFFVPYAWLGAAMYSAGLSSVIGGVTQLLTPQQKSLATQDNVENGASYNFNGPVNRTAQGNPTPVLYGEMYVGSVVVSAGIYSEDQA